MSDLARLLDPESIAIVGLSADSAKHGGRVLANFRKFGFPGEVWGVNPGLPSVEGVSIFASLADLPEAPDLVVCAVPAHAVPKIAMGAQGVGAMMVFAGGFGESGDDGMALEADLSEWAQRLGFRLLGPNSGGVIRRSKGLAASFFTVSIGARERSGPGRSGWSLKAVAPAAISTIWPRDVAAAWRCRCRPGMRPTFRWVRPFRRCRSSTR